jgi:hypothetical protein
MNTNIRNIGSAVGAGVATSFVVSDLLRDGIPAEHGYILAFAISAVALLIAGGTALLIPRDPSHALDPADQAGAMSGGAAAILGTASGVE